MRYLQALSPVLAGISVAACANVLSVSGDSESVAPEKSVVFELSVPESEVLASESVDSAWSEPTEARLMAELEMLLDTSVFLPEVECRSTICGVGFELQRGASIKGTLGADLARQTGLSSSRAYGSRRDDGTQIVAFYLSK